MFKGLVNKSAMLSTVEKRMGHGGGLFFHAPTDEVVTPINVLSAKEMLWVIGEIDG